MSLDRIAVPRTPPAAEPDADAYTRFGPLAISRVSAGSLRSPFVPFTHLASVPDTGHASQAAATDNSIALLLVVAGTIRLDLNGRQVDVGTAQLAVFRLAHLRRIGATPETSGIVVRIAESRLNLTAGDLDYLQVRSLDARVGSISVVRATAFQMYRARGQLDRSAMDRVGHSLMNMIQVFLDESVSERPRREPSGRHTLTEALRYIDLMIGDPRLSPTLIARALGISVRTLHQLFEGQPASVGRTIALRRLEGAKAELHLLQSVGVPIGSVASHWGFSSASQFSRAFRDTYGVSPSMWRRTRGTIEAIPGPGDDDATSRPVQAAFV